MNIHEVHADVNFSNLRLLTHAQRTISIPGGYNMPSAAALRVLVKQQKACGKPKIAIHKPSDFSCVCPKLYRTQAIQPLIYIALKIYIPSMLHMPSSLTSPYWISVYAA